MSRVIIPNSHRHFDSASAVECQKLGCLILHGFTSHADSVNRVPVRLAPYHVPYRMPYLRGHGTQPEDLRGVTWHDWYADARAALHDLRRDVDQVVVIGLSMGGLVANHLTAAHPNDIVGVVSVAAALRFYHKHADRARYVAPFLPMWGDENRDMGVGWHDQETGRLHGNYRRFPPRTFVSLWKYARVVERQLPRITQPILVMHSRADRTIPLQAAQIIYDRVSSSDKELIIFEHSGHEMLRDSESSAVLDQIEAFVQRLIEQPNNKE
ncbi:MAG: alpha/beta fold hydrolase [Herpetosiphon sp.]|nr:alpha/beta fold hydrolase [Herpetosiphon sp.]